MREGDHSRDVCWTLTSPEEASAHQEQKFRTLLLHHLSSPNPAYRHLIERSDIRIPSHPKTDFLKRLPLTDKSFLQMADYAANPAARVFRTVSTSGSTQVAVNVPHNFEASKAALGDNFLRLFRMNNIETDGRIYGIGHWEPHQENTGSFLSFHFAMQIFQQAQMAPTRDPLAVHEERIASMKPSVLASSPAFLGILARHCLARGNRYAIPVVVFGGAPLVADDADAISEAFEPQIVRGFYATTDAGALGAEVDEGVYQTFSETHIFEVVDDDGRPVEPGERGQVAVTALDSLATPIIRYLVGDEVVYRGLAADGHRIALADIRRDGAAIIGDGKIPLAEIDRWRDSFSLSSLRVTALQLAKNRVRDGREHIELRVELRDGDCERAVEVGINLLMENPHVRYLVSAGHIPQPSVVVLRPGELLRGRFKVPAYVDETMR